MCSSSICCMGSETQVGACTPFVIESMENSGNISLETLPCCRATPLAQREKRSASSAKRQLNALAEATGGLTYYPKEVSEVDPIAHQVARDIRSQYTIAYKPTNEALDGSYRKIKVTVKAPGNPVPRTRTGYYATGDQGGGTRKSK